MVQGIFVELAEPDDSFLDVFCCGHERVEHYFRSRAWFAEKSKGGSLTTYVFRISLGGPVVGYAAVSFRNQPHPDDTSTSKAKVLVISMLGVDQAFQGQQNPLAPGYTYAASIMAELEERARSKANCVGLKLWVRSTNDHAIGFYIKLGFLTDPAGPFQLDDGDPMFTMRKLLA
jgi:ribosomal protein S18 acetylase RimI-like enzyme